MPAPVVETHHAGTAGGLAREPAPAAGPAATVKRPLSGKLARAVVLAVAVALLINLALGLWQETQRWTSAKRESLVGTGEILAAATGRAIVARDASALRQALRAVGKIPDLLYVAVEDANGQELASMGDAIRLGTDLDLSAGDAVPLLALLGARTLQMELPVLEGGAPVGTIRLVMDTRDLYARYRELLFGSLWAALVALSIGLVMSLWLQRAITAPLVRLTRLMTGIKQNHSYSVRLDIKNDDEIGVLADSFNTMLSEIKTREEEIVTTLVRAAEYRDTDTGAHVSRVAGYAALIARELGLPEGQCELIGLASTMHDMGKLGVPDSILLKPGPLTVEERAEMERHASVGRQILDGSRSELIQLAADIAHCHHERWDGTGYPRGLAGEAIPLAARIVAVADVFDALTSERPYKAAWPVDRAIAHLESNAGTHFDRNCVAAFMRGWPTIDAAGEHGAR